MLLSLKETVAGRPHLCRSDAALMGRAELLGTGDRDLVEAVALSGQSTQAIARMLGITARVARSRVRRVMRRLNSREFLDAARALAYLPAEDANLARLRFCEGATYRALCARLGLTYHELRRRLDRISAQIETIRRMSRCRRRLPGGR